MSFAKKFGDRYGKTSMNTATKTVKNAGMDATITASKRIVQKIAEATLDLIGNKITSAGKSKSKKSEQNNELYETQ